MIGVIGSTGITLSGLTLLDPIYWTLHVKGSLNVTITNITIRGDWEIFNNDGIDIDSSSDVTVSECDIDTADDALCIKTTLAGVPVRNVYASRCRLRSRAAAVKLGSESVADMQDLLFEDLEVWKSHRGLAIQLRDAGNVRNVTFRRASLDLQHDQLAWWGASEVIYVTAVPRLRTTAVGSVVNVSFSDIDAASENGVMISGAPGQSVHGVTVERLHLRLRRATTLPGGMQDYRPSEQMGVQESGVTAALWVEHATDVALADVAVEYGAPRRPEWKEQTHVDKESTRDVTMQNCTFANESSIGSTSAAVKSSASTFLRLGM